MDLKYLHLIRKTRIVESLKRLIHDQTGHEIIIFDEGYNDVNGNKVSKAVLNQKLQSCDTLFVHFMDIEKARIVNGLTPEKKIVWFFWGGDGYHLGKFYNQFILPKTQKLRLKLAIDHFWNGGWKDVSKIVLGPLSDYFYPNYQVLKAIRNVDYIVPIVPQDYYILTSRYNFSAELFHLNYINDVFSTHPSIDQYESGKNILLGNSAHFSNNHMEAIDKLASYELGERKVIIPLSYGDEQYAKYIKKYARQNLGENTLILDNYLPLNEYRRLIASCNIMMMNQCRQQALGNVIIALWFEKTLYLNKKSGLYEYLVGHDFNILTVNEYKVGNILNQQQLGHNKKQLYKVFGPDVQREKFRKLTTHLADVN